MKFKFDKWRYIKNSWKKFFGIGIVISFLFAVSMYFNQTLSYVSFFVVLCTVEFINILLMINRIRTKKGMYVQISGTELSFLDIRSDGYKLDSNYGRRSDYFWYRTVTIDEIKYCANGIKISGIVIWEREKRIDSNIKRTNGEINNLFIPACFEKWEEFTNVLRENERR